jgi:hypothetical protein
MAPSSAAQLLFLSWMVILILKATPVLSDTMLVMTSEEGSFVGKGPAVSESVTTHDAAETTKLLVDVAVTPSTATAINPEVAPDGTVTVSDVAVAAVTVAAMPLMVTTLSASVVLKFVPVIIMVAPMAPLPVKLAMVGAVLPSVITVKSAAEVAILLFTVTVIFPVVVAPEGTVTVSCVAVAFVTVATVPLTVTVLLDNVALKFVPVMTTVEPTAALVGVKLVMVGDALLLVDTVKSPEEVAVWLLTVTVIAPDVAPEGTVIVSCVVVAAVTVAVVPLNVTVLLAAVALKLRPVMTTVVPTAPLAGVKLVIDGVGVASSSLLQLLMMGTIMLLIPSRFKNSFRCI